jgi:hypothetical protein
MLEYIYHLALRANWDGVSRFSTRELTDHKLFKPYAILLRDAAQASGGSLWANILPTGASIHRHNHEPSKLTAVYFLTEGPALQFDTREIACIPGDIACFKGSSYHWVETNLGPDRISLAMNFP